MAEQNFATGFAATFAPAYTNSANKTAENKAESEKQEFKYKMDTLVAEKTRRQKKQDEEAQTAEQAAALAKSLGVVDGEGAAQIHQMIQGGVPASQIQEGFTNGTIIRNTNYTQPRSTIQVPTAVSGTPAQSTSGYRDPQVSAPNSTPGLPSAVAPQFSDAETGTPDPVNPAVLAKAPTQLGDTMPAHDPEDTTPSTTPFVFKAKDQKNIADLPTLFNNVAKAKNANDPAALRTAQQELQSAQQAEQMKSEYAAKAAGKNVQKYIVTDDQGNILPGGLITAETRPDSDGKPVLYNIGNPTNPLPVTGIPHAIDDKDRERYYTIQDKFGEKAQKYKDASSNFIAALGSTQQMEEIAKNNPAALTYAGDLAIGMNKVGGDIEPLWGQLTQLSNAISSEVTSGKFDKNTIEAKIAQYNKVSDDFLSKSLLSPSNEKLAIDAARYRIAQMRAAINLAAAEGNSGKGMSDKDFQVKLQQLGGETGRSNTAIPVIHDTVTSVLQNLDAMRGQLDNDGSVRSFERDTGIKTGLTGDSLRIGNMILNGGGGDHAAAVQRLQYFNNINNGYQTNKNQAGEIASGQAANPVTGQQNNSLTKTQPDSAVPVKTKEDFDKLPSGVLFVAPDGTVRRKP